MTNSKMSCSKRTSGHKLNKLRNHSCLRVPLALNLGLVEVGFHQLRERPTPLAQHRLRLPSRKSCKVSAVRPSKVRPKQLKLSRHRLSQC